MIPKEMKSVDWGTWREHPGTMAFFKELMKYRRTEADTVQYDEDSMEKTFGIAMKHAGKKEAIDFIITNFGYETNKMEL